MQVPIDTIVEKGKLFCVRKPSTDQWYDLALGTSEVHIGINLVNKTHTVVVEIYINNSKELFDVLHEKKMELRKSLEWISCGKD